MVDEEMAITTDAVSASDAETQMEEGYHSAGRADGATVNTSDGSEDQSSSAEVDGTDGAGEAAHKGSAGVPMDDDGDDSSGAEDAGDALVGANSLVKSLVPTTKTFDRHVKILIHNKDHNLYFDQWKRKLNHKSTVKRLRMSFEELLPRLMGARDYAGAAKVLEVMYHRFTVTPALCIEASLEILRRQPDYRNDLLSYYEAALNVERIDKLLILKEMWLFHIVHGEFYEAYHLYQDKIEQLEEVENDARLLANFGILCYWLMFIESQELRDMLKREDMEYEDDEDEDMNASDGNGVYASESIESVIESNYLFKTPIGVHILYQQASNALRRAVALSPNSAMFVEYYVQLLVLVGDIQPACDYLEAFYHMNPEDPHGPRMVRWRYWLRLFLVAHVVSSSACTVFRMLLSGFGGSSRLRVYQVCIAVIARIAFAADNDYFACRWMKDDPTCSYPLEKMLELSSAGAVSSFVLTKVLVEALDTCGSDLYVAQNPNVSLTLWRNLAELLAAMDEGEFLLDQVGGGVPDQSNQVTLADVGAQHSWWKRIYFARPNTVQEVVAMSKRDGTFVEVSIYRAAVADRLFPGHLPMTEALRSAMGSPDVTFSHEHVRLFKR
ncbi:hypothetical protein AM587_10007879 [Phytophthora nicotianae]|uniref:Uncharacterized protein n=1 Tax=Phytophthora nicotianae TaxID=4792 RepID=A0A0W8CWN3_PHYNI|nr:hypothetical protein AM587_10007879 [Phytophthora nicotianae]